MKDLRGLLLIVVRSMFVLDSISVQTRKVDRRMTALRLLLRKIREVTSRRSPSMRKLGPDGEG
jgi:hypothetical protein